METMLEYLTYTKGWEYIFAITFVFGFIGFWEILSREKKSKPRPR